MATCCAPACSQALPVKPQGVWARGSEAWAGSRDLRNLEFVRWGSSGPSSLMARHKDTAGFFIHNGICVVAVVALAIILVQFVKSLKLIWKSTPVDLTHWGRDKMAAIFQTTFSNAFSGMKMCKFRFRFHLSLFPRVQLTIFQHWFR